MGRSKKKLENCSSSFFLIEEGKMVFDRSFIGSELARDEKEEVRRRERERGDSVHFSSRLCRVHFPFLLLSNCLCESELLPHFEAFHIQ